MKEVNSLGSRVMPSTLDAKRTSNKTLADLRAQLQTGSILNAVVSELTSDGDVIFTTTEGKFISSNDHHLNQGDKVTLKLIFTEDKLSALITKVNDYKTNYSKPIKLNFHHPVAQQSTSSQSNTTYSSLEEISTRVTIEEDPSEFKGRLYGQIKYINLSDINKNSALYKALANATQGTSISLKISPNDIHSLSPYQVVGEVVSDAPGLIFIKAPFGILSIESKSKMPIGKQVIIKLMSVGDNVIKNLNTKSQVMDLWFKLNDNPIMLQTLIAMSAHFKPAQYGQDKESPDTRPVVSASGEEELQTFVKSVLQSSTNKDFSELTKVYGNLKDMLTTTNVDSKWISFFIPIFWNGKVLRQKISVQKQSMYSIRFMIDLSLKGLGDMALDGLITVNTDTMNPEAFNLHVKHKNSLDIKMQQELSTIFNSSSDRILANLSFENIDD